jgi:oligopeptide/dipeptide ABC transporter ATP-binding protein
MTGAPTTAGPLVGAPGTPGAPVLEVRHLSKQFAIRNSRKLVHACDDVSLELYSGQTLGLIGESGSGKTTVGRCVLRLIDPTSGSVLLDSADITKSSKRELRRLRGQMQIVFQEPAESFNPVLTVGSQIELALKVFSDLNPAGRKRRVSDLLDRVGVPAVAAGLLPGALPAGVLQKCSIARALASEPRLLVLDEPTSALAPEAEADVLGLLTELQQDFGLAYLFISHDLSLVRSFCDFVAVMYLGQIVELGPKADVYTSPRHPYTQALLAAVLRPDPRQRLTRSGQGAELKGEIPSPIDLPAGCYLASRCKYVTDRCSAERQELIQIDTSTVVRCWRAGDLPVAPSTG